MKILSVNELDKILNESTIEAVKEMEETIKREKTDTQEGNLVMFSIQNMIAMCVYEKVIRQKLGIWKGKED